MLQTAGEDLLKFAKEREWRVFRFFHILVNFFEVKIPVMVVFTKYDKFTKDLEFPFVGWRSVNYGCNLPVSFDMAATAGAILMELTKVMRENLRDVEGSLWALWATAQQVNARQKSNSQSGTFSPRYMSIGIMTWVRFLAKALRASSIPYYLNFNTTYALSQNFRWNFFIHGYYLVDCIASGRPCHSSKVSGRWKNHHKKLYLRSKHSPAEEGGLLRT